MMGLTRGSYEAYCFDQAIWYFGTYVSNKIEEVGRKKERGEAGKQAARERQLNKYLGNVQKQQFADPLAYMS